ncbi:MAG: NAD(P)-dependent oxidoreductase, partial [candidate division NC10 bacterium]
MIVVPDDFPSVFACSAAHERAKQLGEVRVYSERGADDEAELIRRIGKARVAVNIRAHARFTDGVFIACPTLKMVSVWGTGTDNVDLNTAGMRGVTVCNTPGVNAFAVAEHALTLMLAVARKITILDREMRAGKWPREMLTQLLGKTLGVFGMGTIGRRMAALGRGIGMDVLGWSALGDARRIRAAGARPCGKEEILRQADVVSLHVRLSTETRGFIGKKDFGLMKPSAILVYTGRGALDAANKHYGCSNVAGLDMENEGVSATVASHWDRRILKDDVIAPAGGTSLSNVTLGFLGDSGHYFPVY